MESPIDLHVLLATLIYSGVGIVVFLGAFFIMVDTQGVDFPNEVRP